LKLLLHACCGPCACYPTEKLAEEGVEFDIFWYNPNIHPYLEFKHRLATLRDFCIRENYQLFIDKSYPIEQTIKAMMAEAQCRCRACYRVRLRRVAVFAKKHNYDAFSTTLLVSPYQKHDFIKEIAQEAAAEFGIPFHYEDWREGYQKGVERSLQLGLYRQQYCGCVFSERDRYEIIKEQSSQEELVRVSKNLVMVKEGNHELQI